MALNIEGYANNGGRAGGLSLITDKHGRLRISAGLAKFLYISGKDAEFYLGFDRESGRIALGSPEFMTPDDMKPVRFDAKRRYASARPFFAQFGIPLEAARYDYEDKVNHWLLFRRVAEV
ncbi:hypothetical protein D3C81_1095630 [compost metagenome]